MKNNKNKIKYLYGIDKVKKSLKKSAGCKDDRKPGGCGSTGCSSDSGDGGGGCGGCGG